MKRVLICSEPHGGSRLRHRHPLERIQILSVPPQMLEGIGTKDTRPSEG